MPELVGHGWIADGEPWWDMSQGSWFKNASVDLVLECLEHAYEERGGGSAKAREFALAYDARTVFQKHWVPILEQIADRITERTTMPAVRLRRNRVAA
jgi:hypothetical protein